MRWNLAVWCSHILAHPYAVNNSSVCEKTSSSAETPLIMESRRMRAASSICFTTALQMRKENHAPHFTEHGLHWLGTFAPRTFRLSCRFLFAGRRCIRLPLASTLFCFCTTIISPCIINASTIDEGCAPRYHDTLCHCRCCRGRWLRHIYTRLALSAVVVQYQACDHLIKKEQ